MVLLDILKEVADKNPQNVAFIESNSISMSKTSFFDIYYCSLAAGQYFKKQGIKKGMYVTVLIPMSVKLYETLIALWSIGAIPVFFDVSASPEYVRKCSDIVKPSAVIGTTKTLIYEKVKNIFPDIPKINFKSRNIGFEYLPSGYEKDIEDLGAIVTFTSGSTGVPKTLVRTHQFLIDQYEVIKNNFGYEENAVDLGILPIFTLANLASGITTVIPDSQLKDMSRINAKNILKQIELFKITSMTVSPDVLRQIFNYSDKHNIPLDSLKTLHIGGGPVFPNMLSKLSILNVNAYVVYGSSEAEPISIISWKDMIKDIKKIKDGYGLPVGKVVPEVNLKIIYNDNAFPDKKDIKDITELETDIGEIVVSGKNVLPGYLNGVGDAENKIKDGVIWHKTGDCGYIDKDNNLWLVGRKNNFIKSDNEIIYAFPLQCTLNLKYGIHKSAFIQSCGKNILVLEKKDIQVANSISENILKKYKCDDIMFVEKMPMDKRHNAKVDINALKKML